ncbi:MAG: hypothetical protein ACR2PX_17080, partial [Endozoicomonas sp.]|uniref:hypothetical protein n=1 Tax=Endozoicomonas sp. TaxID=1892382 RepID=UPI003D9BE516
RSEGVAHMSDPSEILILINQSSPEGYFCCNPSLFISQPVKAPINKVKTDNFAGVFSALSDLVLPISAMDIRKVQSIVREIYTGGDIKVNITEDLDSLDNRDKIIAIGSTKTISYHYQSSAEMMANYFEILDESNSQILSLINKYTIQGAQYFPVFAFSKIYSGIERLDDLKQQQVTKVNSVLDNVSEQCKEIHSDISSIHDDESITRSNKDTSIIWNICQENIHIDELESYLRIYPDKTHTTAYRKLLCVFDYKKYG